MFINHIKHYAYWVNARNHCQIFAALSPFAHARFFLDVVLYINYANIFAINYLIV